MLRFAPFALKMDARRVFPQSHHPISLLHTPDTSGFAPHLSRTHSSVVYYFNHLRCFVRYKNCDDPLGPNHDMENFARILQGMLSEVRLSVLVSLSLEFVHDDLETESGFQFRMDWVSLDYLQKFHSEAGHPSARRKSTYHRRTLPCIP